MKEEILTHTAKEYYNAAKDELAKKRFNSAVVLFFKSLVALVDLFLLKQTGDTPSSHTYRFRICESQFPEVYFLLDKDFPFYQDSYEQIMTKELAEAIMDDVQTLAEKTKTRM